MRPSARWSEPKAGRDEVAAPPADDAWESIGTTTLTAATRLLKAWLEASSREFSAAGSTYSSLDDDGRVFVVNADSPNPRPDLSTTSSTR